MMKATKIPDIISVLFFIPLFKNIFNRTVKDIKKYVRGFARHAIIFLTAPGFISRGIIEKNSNSSKYCITAQTEEIVGMVVNHRSSPNTPCLAIAL